MDSNLRLVSREQWGAARLTKEEDEKEKSVYLPAGQVIIHTAGTGTDTCHNRTDCALLLRDLQNKHTKELGYSDIAHNFLVASDGTVYEGRGWMTRFELTNDEHADYHSASYDVTYIGDFRDKPPTPLMAGAVADLIKFGTMVGFIRVHYELIHDSQGITYDTEPSDKKLLDDSDSEESSEEQQDSDETD